MTRHGFTRSLLQSARDVRASSRTPPQRAARFDRVALFVAALGNLAASAGAQGATRLVSAPSVTQPANGDSGGAKLSADGRFLAFASSASNLVAGDVGDFLDVFVRDLQTGVITRESVSSTGVAPNAHTYGCNLTGDGRFVLFANISSSLVPGHSPNGYDLFVRDRATSTTAVVSYGLGGVPGNGSVGVIGSVGPSISHDGRFVAFVSYATNMVVGDTNGTSDVFVRDRVTGGLERIPVLTAGAEPNGYAIDVAISADGRQVVFTSAASNLVPGDVNGATDVFAYDRWTGGLTLVSATAGGVIGDALSDQGVVSADGQWVAFTSQATNFAPSHVTGERQVFLKNLATLALSPASFAMSGSAPDLSSDHPAISADGRFVVFNSEGSDLADYDFDFWKRDVYQYDRVIGTTRRISVSSSLTEDYIGSAVTSISADASSIAFVSTTNELVLGQTYGQGNIYVHVSGVDESLIECSGNGLAVNCPCGLVGIQNRGCANSVASNGAGLRAEGSPSISADSILLRVTAVPYGTSVLYVQSTATAVGGVGSFLGDGLSCVRGSVRRLGTRATGGGIHAEPGSNSSLGPNQIGGVRISQVGGVTAGATRWYQAFYRDSAPFCTSATLNATNSFRIEWQL